MRKQHKKWDSSFVPSMHLCVSHVCTTQEPRKAGKGAGGGFGTQVGLPLVYSFVYVLIFVLQRVKIAITFTARGKQAFSHFWIWKNK